MDVFEIYKQVIKIIAQLAPLSVLIAALTLINNLRQAKIKRKLDEANALREVFSRLGVKSYLLNWSLIGNSQIMAAVLHIREAIEARLGNNPSSEELRQVISDQILFESLVEKALQDSKFTEKFQMEALEFGKFKADLGNRIPLLEEALQIVEVQLRMLFLLNTFLIFSIRNDQGYKALGQSETDQEVMEELHRLLLRASMIKDKNSFSEGCKFIEEISDAATRADDDTILQLAHYRLSWIENCKCWLAEQRRQYRERKKYNELIQNLKQNAPKEFQLLKISADNIKQKKRISRNNSKLLEQSGNHILRTLKGVANYNSLKKTIEKLIESRNTEESEDLETMSTLLKIRSLGIEDPNIDIFLASSMGTVQLVQSAIQQGASVNISLSEVIEKHKDYFNKDEK